MADENYNAVENLSFKSTKMIICELHSQNVHSVKAHHWLSNSTVLDRHHDESMTSILKRFFSNFSFQPKEPSSEIES